MLALSIPLSLAEHPLPFIHLRSVGGSEVGASRGGGPVGGLTDGCQHLIGVAEPDEHGFVRAWRQRNTFGEHRPEERCVAALIGPLGIVEVLDGARLGPAHDPEQRADHARCRAVHFRRVVEEGKVYAQPFSEGSAAAAGKAPFGTTAKKVDGGWLINGRKIFASLSGAADYYGILCTEDKGDETPDARDTLYISVPATAEGFAISGEWDPLGMRGTVSRNLAFKDVFVSDAEQLMPRGIYFKGAQTWPAMFFTLSPTYLGIANAAYDFTVQYLRGEVPGEPPVKRRMYATKQIAVAQMRIQLENMRSIFVRAIQEAKPNPSKDEKMRLYAAHYSVMEGANDIARLAIRTCGGQSMMKHLPLERLYRDSRCGALMLPWTAELILDRMGRETLYEAGEKDQ